MGILRTAPYWSGMDSQFTIEAEELRLDADPSMNQAYLSISSTAIQNATWEFQVRLDFNPSSANYARIYLVSDQSNLTQPLNGYYVLLGNNEDEVSLFKQTGTSHTKIIDGRDNLLNLPTIAVRIKATHFHDGSWELYSDLGSLGAYFSEGSVLDTTHLSSNYFGVLCAYTATRSDKFYFDDFFVAGDAYVDTFPPELEPNKCRFRK